MSARIGAISRIDGGDIALSRLPSSRGVQFRSRNVLPTQTMPAKTRRFEFWRLRGVGGGRSFEMSIAGDGPTSYFF